MHVERIVQELLGSSIHKTRMKNISVLIAGLIESKELKLTSLGRSIKTKAKESSSIKRVDRFLGNGFYQKYAIEIYRAITAKAITGMLKPLIIVDWSSLPGSHLTKNGEQCVLRASLAAQGRSITLYEEVHPKTKEGNSHVHKTFLAHLKTIVPHCTPCILTDAGFKNPWFKAVVALGWDYIGRLNSTVHYDDGSDKGFEPLSNLEKEASTKPKAKGEVILAKTNPLKTNLVLYKKISKGRKHQGKSGQVINSKQSRKHAKSNSQPWYLASSLKENELLIIKYYKLRMTIEESFRDTKSQRYGLSLNDNITMQVQRYTVWLLLAAITSFIAWIVGYAAEQLKLHYDFQANTYRHRRVLSFCFLGYQIIRKRIYVPISINTIQLHNWGIAF